MRTFIANIFHPTGEEALLTLKGATLQSVQEYLHKQGYTIKKIQEQEKESVFAKLSAIEIGQKIKPRNLIRLVKTLGKMIGRGYQIESVINFLLADEPEKDVMKLLQTLQRKSQKGYRDYVELFSEAKEYFDDEFFSVVIAGQKTGTVGQNVIDYALGKEKMLEQKGKLLRMLSGKFVILGVVFAAFLTIVLFVVPQFTKLFGEKLVLPLSMKIMVVISSVMRNYWFIVFSFLIAAIVGVLALYQFNQRAKFFFQHILLKTPVVGNLLRMMYTRDFLYMMGNLTSKGVSLMDSIRIVIEQTRNLCFRSVFEAIEHNLKKGRKLEQILTSEEKVSSMPGGFVAIPQGYLLPSVAQAMTLGAKGGNLSEILQEAYQTYDMQLQARISTAITVIGATISIFIYVVIVFMIGSLASTLFKVMKDPTALIN